jgi:hypothetical protein
LKVFAAGTDVATHGLLDNDTQAKRAGKNFQVHHATDASSKGVPKPRKSPLGFRTICPITASGVEFIKDPCPQCAAQKQTDR